MFFPISQHGRKIPYSYKLSRLRSLHKMFLGVFFFSFFFLLILFFPKNNSDRMKLDSSYARGKKSEAIIICLIELNQLFWSDRIWFMSFFALKTGVCTYFCVITHMFYNFISLNLFLLFSVDNHDSVHLNYRKWIVNL